MLSQRFKLETADVIGWTNEQDYSPISFNLVSSYLTRFHSIADDMTYPLINETVTLDTIVFPAVFSVAVEIIQC